MFGCEILMVLLVLLVYIILCCVQDLCKGVLMLSTGMRNTVAKQAI